MYLFFKIVSPENTTPHTNILPVLTVDTGSTPSPLLNNSMNKNNHLAALSLQQPQPPIVSLSAPSSPEEPEVSCNLHEIKCQMQNFVVPTDWYPTGSQAPCFDHESIESINAQKIIAHLKEGIARFEYLIHLEEQKIESNKSEMVEYMKKLKTMDKEAEHVNAMITYGRFDAVTRMKTLLREVNSCVPRLQILRGQHKHTTTSIEGYNKSMNMTDRLEILQVQARTTTRTEAVWTRVRHWGPFITIITLSMLIALLAVR
ncbi:hypothetical protein BDA99DRAFT_240646 [Phascolomyces articulosus]|uniref:Uncharacterized protein n=1 Tax=Phascolomyces articulosus TaxID=60185 RepID=A0AAD5K8F6_9FUNG|nr:hypothetical protein BDA99DRAFT_240646 [Phascolomyces articulosus]